MSETQVQAPAEPAVLEYGRYRLFESPDGGWVVARAVETCETCQNCGCGSQADPIVIPAMVIKLARSQQNGGGLLGKLKAVTSLARDNA